MKKIIAILLLTIGYCSVTTAQTSVTQTVSLTIVNSIAITFVSTGTSTGSTVTIPFTTVSNYANGVASAAQQLLVQSNRNFNVTVHCNTTSFTYSGSTSPSPTMPVSGVLAIKVSANTTGGSIASPFSSSAYATLTGTAQNLITSGTNGGNQGFSIIYNTTPGFAYPAGTYTTSVIYTATQL